MPFDFGEAEDDPVVRSLGSEALPASWEAGRATINYDSDFDSYSRQAYRNLDQNTRNVSAQMGLPAPGEGEVERVLSAEEANAEFGAGGLLTFEGPVAESVAAERRDLAMRSARRSSVYERSDVGVIGHVLGFGDQVLGSFTDPLSVLASAIPVVGQARYAKWLKMAASNWSRAGIRLGVGTASGVVGQAVLEPLAYGVTRAEGRDYSMADSLFNITVGGAFGGGLHTSVGAVADWRGGPSSYAQPRRTVDVVADPTNVAAPARVEGKVLVEGERVRDPVVERIRRAPAATQMEAIATALTQDADGEPVNVAPVFERHEATAGRAADAGEEGLPVVNMRRVRRDVAFTPSGRQLDVTYAIVELRDLVASHDDGLQINPRYPAALQPRDRTRMASEAQIGEIARKLEPRLLMEGTGADTGAPIISARGVVESGNGRVIGLRRAYADGPKGAQYKQALADAGYDIAGFDQPVLARVRDTELIGADRLAFTREANERATAALSAPEQALADAAAISDAAIALHRGGPVTLAGNREFAKAAIQAISSTADQAQFFTRDGQLSADGAARLERALIARAYGDADLVSLLTEAGMEDVRAIGGALLDLSAGWAQMRQRTRDGVLKGEADQTAALVQAVMLVRRARRDGKPVALYMRTDDMFAGSMPPEVEAFTAIFFRDSQLTKPAGRESIGDALNFYLAEANKMDAGPALFGGLDGGQPRDILAAAVARRSGQGGQYDFSLAARPEGHGEDAGPARAAGSERRPPGDGQTAEPGGESQSGAIEPPSLLAEIAAARKAKEPKRAKTAAEPKRAADTKPDPGPDSLTAVSEHGDALAFPDDEHRRLWEVGHAKAAGKGVPKAEIEALRAHFAKWIDPSASPDGALSTNPKLLQLADDYYRTTPGEEYGGTAQPGTPFDMGDLVDADLRVDYYRGLLQRERGRSQRPPDTAPDAPRRAPAPALEPAAAPDDPDIAGSPAVMRAREAADMIRAQHDAALERLNARAAQLGFDVGKLLDEAEADIKADAQASGDDLLADGTEKAAQRLKVDQAARDAAEACLVSRGGMS